MTYSCKSRGCTRSFPSERSLSLHRSSCAHFKAHEAARSAARVERARLALAQREGALEKIRDDLRKKQKLDHVSNIIGILLFLNTDLLVLTTVTWRSGCRGPAWPYGGKL